MLTPPRINRAPAGLLDFLGLKNGGVNPESLSSVVAPTLDMLPWYATRPQQFVGAALTGAVGAVSSFNPELLPPNDELWIVWTMGFEFSCSAIQRVCGNLILDGIGGGLLQPITDFVNHDGAAVGLVSQAGIVVPGVSPTSPMIVTPAAAVRWQTAGGTAGSAVNLYAQYTPIKL